MKKRICFLSVLLLSLFVFCGRVLAAQELSCVYDSEKPIMVVQDKDGNIKIFQYPSSTSGSYGHSKPSFDNGLFVEKVNKKLVYSGNKKVDGYLIDCPEYITKDSDSETSSKVILKDNISYQEDPNPIKLYEKKYEIPPKASSVSFNGLVCIYDKGHTTSKMLIQTSEGEKFLFYAQATDNVDISYNSWLITRKDIDVTIFDHNDKILISCPKYSSDNTYNENVNATFYFSNLKDDPTYVGLLHEYKNCELPYEVYNAVVNNASFYAVDMKFKQRTRFFTSFDYLNSDMYKNEEWRAKCVYGETNNKIELYYNDNTFVLNGSNRKTGGGTPRPSVDAVFDMGEIKMHNGLCPPFIYEGTNNAVPILGPLYAEYSFASRASVWNYIKGYSEKQLPLIKDESAWENGSGAGGNINIDDCEDLLGDDVIKIINDMMKWVKIIVPILLIVFGIVDFTKVIFSGKEDSMGQAGKIFFKRIIAAILVFLAPIFINLILSLANEVWSFINPNTCVNVEKSK